MIEAKHRCSCREIEMFLRQIARPGIFQRLANLATIKNVESLQPIHTSAAVFLVNRMKDRKSLIRTMPVRDDGSQGERGLVFTKKYGLKSGFLEAV